MSTIGASKEPLQIGVTKSLKTMFVLAIREGLNSQLLQSVDPVIKKAKDNVSMEYPVEELQYPGIWLTASFSSLKWDSINRELLHPDGFKFNRGEFDAQISLEIIALSNEERDALVDALVNMIMFGSLESDSDAFYNFLVNEPYIAITPLLGEVKLSQDGVNIGTPWNPNKVAYTKTVTFSVTGHFAQRLDNRQLIDLRALDIEVYDNEDNVIYDDFFEGTPTVNP